MQRNLKVKDKARPPGLPPALLRKAKRAGRPSEVGRGLRIKDASLRIGIAVAEFNADITRKLLAGALKELRASGVRKEHMTVVRVPGSFELPLACQRLAKSKKYHGLIALGCVIKGETDHYYYIAAEAARGIMQVMLKFNIPIGFGVLTTDTLAQAEERAGKKIDFGGSATRAALQMLRDW